MPADWFTPLLLLLDALAVYRVTRLVTEDHLPLGPLRDHIQDRWPGSLLAEWLGCPWCSGMWVSAGVLLLHAAFPTQWPYVAAALALAAVAGLLSSWEQR